MKKFKLEPGMKKIFETLNEDRILYSPESKTEIVMEWNKHGNGYSYEKAKLDLELPMKRKHAVFEFIVFRDHYFAHISIQNKILMTIGEKQYIADLFEAYDDYHYSTEIHKKLAEYFLEQEKFQNEPIAIW